MPEDIKLRLLLAILEYSKGDKAPSQSELYNEQFRAEFDEYHKFDAYLEQLKKEGLIDLHDLKISLTEKGRKELRKWSGANIEFYEALEQFPRYALKKRIENLELFVFWATIFCTAMLLVLRVPASFPTVYLIFITPLLAVLFISIVAISSYFSRVAYFAIRTQGTSTFNKLADFIEDHRNQIGYVLAAVVVIAIIGFVKLVLNRSWIEIIVGLAIGLVFWILTSAQKINSFFKNLKIKRPIEK